MAGHDDRGFGEPLEGGDEGGDDVDGDPRSVSLLSTRLDQHPEVRPPDELARTAAAELASATQRGDLLQQHAVRFGATHRRSVEGANQNEASGHQE